MIYCNCYLHYFITGCVSQVMFHFGLQASAPALPAASPEAVQQLVAMGFDPQRAAAALQQSHNDVQAALTYLL